MDEKAKSKPQQPCKGGMLSSFIILPSPRICLSAALPFLLPLSTTFMAWKALCLLTNSSFPIVCVISESMAPAFHRGDVLILWNRVSSVKVGDIPVVWFEGNPLPMVHRVIRVFWETDDISGKLQQMFLTKGDNNALDDVSLYPGHRTLVSKDEVVGFVRGFIPFIGLPVIAFQEVYWIKFLVFFLVATLVFIGA